MYAEKLFFLERTFFCLSFLKKQEKNKYSLLFFNNKDFGVFVTLLMALRSIPRTIFLFIIAFPCPIHFLCVRQCITLKALFYVLGQLILLLLRRFYPFIAFFHSLLKGFFFVEQPVLREEKQKFF